MDGVKGAFGAAMALVSGSAAAQEPAAADARNAAEVAVGVFEHGSNFHPLGGKLFFDKPPPGVLYEGQEEDGTADVQLAYRSVPLTFALKPRLTAKAQISTAGRTSFASIGAEWRQHAFRRRVYVQGGIGVTVHDGYRFTPDPFAPGLGITEAQRRYDIYLNRVSFGSRILFNPNASLGIRVNHRWAAELAWEHFSHRQIFSDQNPGIDNVGLRLVRSLGRRAR